MNELVQNPTPSSPVPADFEKDPFSRAARLGNRRLEVDLRISISIVFRNGVDRSCLAIRSRLNGLSLSPGIAGRRGGRAIQLRQARQSQRWCRRLIEGWGYRGHTR